MALSIVSDTVASHARLHSKRFGENAIFSGSNSIVHRRAPEENLGHCVCYTQHPLPPGQVWQITIFDTSSQWKGYGGLVSFVFSIHGSTEH